MHKIKVIKKHELHDSSAPETTQAEAKPDVRTLRNWVKKTIRKRNLRDRISLDKLFGEPGQSRRNSINSAT